MISKFFRTERGRQRRLGTPLAPYIDGYLVHRRGQGYAHRTLDTELQWLTGFGEYLRERTLNPEGLSESVSEEFVEYYRSRPPRPGRKPKAIGGARATGLRSSLREFLAYLRSIGVAQPAMVGATTRNDGALEDYLSFLRVHRGLMDGTIRKHRYWCERRRGAVRSAVQAVARLESTAIAPANLEAWALAGTRTSDGPPRNARE